MTSATKTQEVKKITVVPVLSEAYFSAIRKKDQKRRKLYANICCAIIAIVIFGSSVSLITVGALKSVEDLIILGCILIFGGVIVLILLFGKHVYPILVKARAKVSDKYTEEEKLHRHRDKQDKDYTEHLKSNIGNISKKSKPSEQQLYDENILKTDTGAEGGERIEFPRPPPISFPGVKSAYITRQDLEVHQEQKHSLKITAREPNPSTDTLYSKNNSFNEEADHSLSPPPPYVVYPNNENIDTKVTFKL